MVASGSKGFLALWLLASFSALPACGAERGTSLQGRKALFIIAPKGFRDEELQVPTATLKARGCEVTVASLTTDVATGMLGARVKPDIALDEAKPADYDLVVFVGGVGAKVYFDHPRAHAIAREAAAAGKLLGAICIAPSVLARAGLLKDKTATAWPSQRRDLVANGAKWDEGPAVRDGKIITANGPKAARRFADLLVEALGGK